MVLKEAITHQPTLEEEVRSRIVGKRLTIVPEDSEHGQHVIAAATERVVALVLNPEYQAAAQSLKAILAERLQAKQEKPLDERVKESVRRVDALNDLGQKLGADDAAERMMAYNITYNLIEEGKISV